MGVSRRAILDPQSRRLRLFFPRNAFGKSARNRMKSMARVSHAEIGSKTRSTREPLIYHEKRVAPIEPYYQAIRIVR